MPVFTLDSNRLPAEQLAVRTITTEIAVVENIKQFNTFAEFYPYYLSEHANSTCRRLHFIGTTLEKTQVFIYLLRKLVSHYFVLYLSNEL